MEPMPETKTERSPAARARHSPPRRAAQRSTQSSDGRRSSIDDGARSAIEALRKFSEKVDRSRADSASIRQEITDSALQTAQRLVHTQSALLRKLVDDASKR